MSRVRDILFKDYARHYARVNDRADPSAPSRRQERALARSYGWLVSALSPGSRVLDLGCGSGLLLGWLARQPGLLAHGVDVSESQVAICREKLPGVQVDCCDGQEYLSRHEAVFAGIFCIDVLEHLPTLDDCLALLEAARGALVPGGFIYCRAPNAANLTGGYSRHMDLTHERAFTSTSLLQLLEAAGFSRCEIVPTRAHSLAGRLRHIVEYAIHRAVFLVCARPRERVFSKNVCAVGYR